MPSFLVENPDPIIGTGHHEKCKAEELSGALECHEFD